MMFRKKVLYFMMGQITIFGLVILLGWVPGVAAVKVQADTNRYTSILAEAMQPIDSSIQYNNVDSYLTTVQHSTMDAMAEYIGQLNLPDGSRITGVLCEGRDTDPAGQFYYRLYRYSYNSTPVFSGVTDFAYSGYYEAKGNLGVEAEVVPENAIVDNRTYSYGIFLSLPKATSGDLKVLRCLVATTTDTFLPLIQNNGQ